MKYLKAFKAEIKFEMILYFQNTMAVITDLIVFIGLFFAFIMLNSGLSLAKTYQVDTAYAKVLMLVGYIVWTFSSKALSCVSSDLNYEASHGYLFFKLTSVLPLEILYLGKFIGSIFSQFIIMVPIFLFSFFLYSFSSGNY